MKQKDGLLAFFTLGCFLVVFGILGVISKIYKKLRRVR